MQGLDGGEESFITIPAQSDTQSLSRLGQQKERGGWEKEGAQDTENKNVFNSARPWIAHAKNKNHYKLCNRHLGVHFNTNIGK